MLNTDLMHVERPDLSERTRGMSDKGAPRPSWPPAASGGSGHSGTPRRAATRQPAPEGTVCNVPTCLATGGVRDGGQRLCAVQSACNLP